MPFVVEGYFALAKGVAGAGVLFLWPSSIMLVTTESMPPSEQWQAFAASVAINVALYALIGGVVSWLRGRAHREV